MNKKNDSRIPKLPFFGIGKVLPYLKKYKKVMAVMILGGAVGSVYDVVIPVFQRYALDHFITPGTLEGLPLYIVLYFAAIVLAALANYAAALMGTRIEVSVDKDLRNEAFAHMQTLSFSYFNQNSVGYIHSRVMSDTGRIGQLVSWTVLGSIWQLGYVIGAVVVMFAINARLALLVVAVLPLAVLFYAIFQGRLTRVNREIRELNSQITGDFNEGITGARTVKTLVIENTMARAFVSDTAQMRRKAVQGARLRGFFAVTMNLASSLALALVLWKGGYIARTQIGTFSLFMSYAQGMMEPVRWIVDAISDLITTQVNIERLTRLLETEPDVKDSDEVTAIYGDSFEPKKENWEELHGDIAFEDVSFRYPDGDETILEHFNLKIPFGTNVAIVGETGAGKSTLANLICRFYEPTAGRVLIDGRDARERSQLWLHAAIGYVLQTPHLFSGSVRDNLLYGKPDATDADIDRALALVSAKSVIEKLEKGLDTDVGEGGDMLSTGEKQLLSFARAILAEPKILVLDENADVILVVRDGKIVEQGRHEELMRLRGHYYRLYTRQYEDEATSALLA